MTGRGDALVGLGYRAAWSAAVALPRGAESTVRAVIDRLADRAARRPGPGVRQYARNLYRVLSHSSGAVEVTSEQLYETVRLGLRSYARYWWETFRMPAMDLGEVTARAAAGTPDLAAVRASAESGRGLIMALPHSGNWDVAGLMMAQLFGGITSVAERLKPESLYDRFVAYRESLGFEILPLTGGASAASTVLKERLTAGKVVCLLADRDLTSSGVPVDFFGAQTRMPAGPAMLAALTGADLIAVHLTFTADGWHQHVSEPLQLPGKRLAEQVRGGTQLIADHFAAGIASRPQDWHMLQPLWIADLPQDRRAALERRPAR
jgi:phosphatidylinositol dimannoside acyltransferase